VDASRSSQHAFTLIELLLVVALFVVVSSVSVPLVATSLDSSRTWGAAKYLAGRLNFARSEAVKRSVFVAMRVQAYGTSYRCTLYLDGNENGVRTADIDRRVDAQLGAPERIDEKFGGVTFGILDGVTAVDSSELLGAGTDPVRFGQSDLISFNPNGSASAGTLYLRGRGRHQVAVRVLGITGRVRVLRYRFDARQWEMR
jgi:prepilin-type N-terminal cleavage/methylation domain-containing protein